VNRPLIIGQAPARGNDDKLPFAGQSGSRLAQAAGVGWTGDSLPAHFELRNLVAKYPGKAGTGKGDRFDLAAARLQASLMLDEIEQMESRWVLFMGKSVAQAFGIRGKLYLEPWPWKQHEFVVFPHPSGINRWWNDADNEEEARDFLRSLLDGG
jgi:uracil-DNA glycosylase